MDKPEIIVEDIKTEADGEAITFTAEEIAGIEAAEADVAARGSIPLEEVLAWLDSLDTSTPLPEPQPRHFT